MSAAPNMVENVLQGLIRIGKTTLEDHETWLATMNPKVQKYLREEIFTLDINHGYMSTDVKQYQKQDRFIGKEKFTFTTNQIDLITHLNNGHPKEIAICLSRYPDWYNYLKKNLTLDMKTSKGRVSVKGAIFTLRERANDKITPTMTLYMQKVKHVSKKDVADAKWVLTRAMEVYEDCRSDGNHTQAIKALEVIGKHIDVDAFVSNRVLVENTVDYAAILSSANNRAIEAPKDPVVPVINEEEETNETTH